MFDKKADCLHPVTISMSQDFADRSRSSSFMTVRDVLVFIASLSASSTSTKRILRRLLVTIQQRMTDWQLKQFFGLCIAFKG